MGIIYKPDDFKKKKTHPEDITTPQPYVPPTDMLTQLKMLHNEIEKIKEDIKKIKEALRSLGVPIE